MISSKTVWLIDDDELFNFLTANTLQTNNFAGEIKSFTDPKEALKKLEACAEKAQFPDLIFLDINMPVLDGWGFLASYRKLPKELKDSCTLFILSSSIDEDDAKRARINEDVRDFISKPLSKMDLEVIKFQIAER